ncbi:DUF1876 domain-containing protein [Streptomyces sp. NPDC047000]|uniref:DUF1876 domain-containing protein n=1 Tax=Streptomyces sp. NPDC047000 TaxID=3155474 RepID=UPI0033ED4D58
MMHRTPDTPYATHTTHAKEWRLHLYLAEDEDEGTTKARVVLDTKTGSVTGTGTARRNPADSDVPEIGDELAAGRALHDLARRLLATAEDGIEDHGATEGAGVTWPEVGWPM